MAAETSGTRRAPGIRQVCRRAYPAATVWPEFAKKRPEAVISKNPKLHGAVTAVPLTAWPQDGKRFAV